MPYQLPVHQIQWHMNLHARPPLKGGCGNIINLPYPDNTRVRVKSFQNRVLNFHDFPHFCAAFVIWLCQRCLFYFYPHFCADFCACEVCWCHADTNLGLKTFNFQSYPFTAPDTIPLCTCLLNNRYMTIVGTVATIRPAPIVPQSVVYLPTICIIPTVSVRYFSELINVMANIISFQVERNVNTEIVAKAGLTNGIIIWKNVL